MVWRILVVISVLVLLAGLNYLTPATVGVGVVGIACYVAILARIAQAQDHTYAPDERERSSGEPEAPYSYE